MPPATAASPISIFGGRSTRNIPARCRPALRHTSPEYAAASASRNRFGQCDIHSAFFSAKQNSEYKAIHKAVKTVGCQCLAFTKLFVALSFAILLISSASSRRAEKFTLLNSSNSQNPRPALATHDRHFRRQRPARRNSMDRRGSDFFFATRAASLPLLMIDDLPGPTMNQLSGTDLGMPLRPSINWASSTLFITPSRRKIRRQLDVPAFTPFSISIRRSSGTLSEKITHVSKIYDGMKSEYWFTFRAIQIRHPRAVMIFQRRCGYTDRNGTNPRSTSSTISSPNKIPS